MNGLGVFILLCGVVFVSAVDGDIDAPVIITKAQWGGKPPKKSIPLSENPPPYVVIHHSSTPGCTMQATCQARIRSFQNYHMNDRGWDDIGYNFIIGEDGNIYEGRGWDLQGAHAPSYNSKSIGICLIGNFTDRDPSPAAITAAKKLIAWGASSGKINSNYKLIGHRQATATECPGNKLYNTIKTWPKWTANP